MEKMCVSPRLDQQGPHERCRGPGDSETRRRTRLTVEGWIAVTCSEDRRPPDAGKSSQRSLLPTLRL